MSTEVTIQSNSARPLYSTIVRDGVPGNYEVLYEMIRIIRNSVDYDLGLQREAAGILLSAGLNSYSPGVDQLRAVFAYVASRVTYIQDISGRIESLKDARQTLSDKYGDCDDQAVLNASLLGCLGFENVKIAMAKYQKQAQSFAHVYCICYVNGKRYVLDTSLPNASFDQEIKPQEIREVGVFDNVNGYDGLSGAYSHIRHHARKAARFATRIVPGAVSVLPFGLIAGNALATGANLIDRSGDTALSVSATGSNIIAELDKIIYDLLRSRIAYDLAKTQALSIAANLAAVQAENEQYAFTVVRASIKDKLDFINKFPEYAKANNIKIVYLDSTKMLCAGLALAGGTAYVLYRNYRYRNQRFI